MDGTLEDMRELSVEHGQDAKKSEDMAAGSMCAEDAPDQNGESLERIVAGLYRKLDIL